jgi:predicted nuclease of restriction endonuclease-like (RecB) superfamily
MIGNQKLPAVMREFDIDVSNTFKDSYVFEFLNLPELHSERQLQKALIVQMKNFILEPGKDFLFVGEEYRLQVGNSDFMIDLLFYHRSLRCLVAFELKADKFKPNTWVSLTFTLKL